MNSVKCGIRTTLYGNFRKCGTRFYPVRSGAVQGFSNGRGHGIAKRRNQLDFAKSIFFH